MRLSLAFILLFAFNSMSQDAQYQAEYLKVSKVPTLDDFDFWSRLSKAKQADGRSFQAFHNGERIFILLSFQAQQDSAKHKVWQKKASEISLSQDKETALHLLINDLKDSRQQYDYWFWSSIRTQPYGFADDRQALLNQGQLTLKADSGQACYNYQFNSTMLALREESHRQQKASGSRADVHATAKWLHNEWQILLTRKLNTAYADDLIFRPGQSYQLSYLKKEGKISPLVKFQISRF